MTWKEQCNELGMKYLGYEDSFEYTFHPINLKIWKIKQEVD